MSIVPASVTKLDTVKAARKLQDKREKERIVKRARNRRIREKQNKKAAKERTKSVKAINKIIMYHKKNGEYKAFIPFEHRDVIKDFEDAGYIKTYDKYGGIYLCWNISASSEQESEMCCICMNANIDAFWEPCKHASFCFKCIQNLDICPLCRAIGTAGYVTPNQH